MKIKLSMMSLMIIMGLAACTPSVEDLVEDPELLQDTINECNKMSPDDSKDDEACKNASTAIMKNMSNATNNILKGLMGK